LIEFDLFVSAHPIRVPEKIGDHVSDITEGFNTCRALPNNVFDGNT
jgi:hypothetical protein